MTRSTQHIEQDLATLERQVAAFSEELQGRYAQYLQLLGKAIQKQLILASYQICTQTYPQAFLQLSLSQRQTLQQNLRQIGKQTGEKLASVLAGFEQLADSTVSEQKSLEIKILRELLATEELTEEEVEEEESLRLERSPESILPAEEPEESPASDLSLIERLLQSAQAFEKAIAQTLQDSSAEANRLLRSAEVLPMKLPPKLLDLAIQAEESGTATGSGPNLLNLLVEAGKEDSEQESAAIQITAVRLRLSEIEFGNGRLSREREQLRQLLKQGSQLRERYQKRQRELAIAQAELAWRGSWFED